MPEPIPAEVEAPSTRDVLITFGVAEEERTEIRRLAAEYGATVGRPVPVAEYVRDAALQRLSVS
jgi:hypothetical protein